MAMYLATCPEETKNVLMEELKDLGATDIEPIYRGVRFSGSQELFYLCHLKLRTASRLLKIIKEFPARSPEMLFSQARRIPWSELFDLKHGYLIEGVPGDRGQEFMSGNEISKKVREGLQDSFGRKLGTIPKVDLKEPKVVIVAFVAGGRCTLSFDTSGKALHKRGYRSLSSHPAPIKETLAAAMLRLAGYNGEEVLLDPMCGSGTVAIEAAMISLDKSPLIHRKKGEFLLEWLKDFDRGLWRETLEQCRLEKRSDLRAPIYAGDISARYTEMARDHALKARVEKYIHFETKAFEKWEAPAPSGLLVANLPYGERLLPQGRRGDSFKAQSARSDSLEAEREDREFYKALGDHLKKNFVGWRAALLAADKSQIKFIGLKPTKKIPILNGTIPCKIWIFELYEGSRKSGEKPDKTPQKPPRKQ
jgi:putative N6-adenine-specific DNA methylase